MLVSTIAIAGASATIASRETIVLASSLGGLVGTVVVVLLMDAVLMAIRRFRVWRRTRCHRRE